ncbi:hypothetical protein [Halanaerobacter jeridensis]|uniref:Uncharacterized protein n=1 Tax=Halanaerobacter jeridensis TaxID=706427 RepID=A0A939BMX6_9FIRM|nr:hypothetical protein [Halanaerobacter jeridensis]MBM7557720.1 hypothetical protein [Halanaerobacter jeridensis]
MIKKIISFLVIIIFLFTISALAEDEKFKDRLALIRASQNLSVQEESISENKIAIFVTDFGAIEGEVSIGGSLEISLFNQQTARMLNEIIYLKDKESLAGFLSLKFLYPLEKNLSFYLGAGGEVTGKARYQVFAGFNIVEDFFVEAKYINEEGLVTDSNFYLATGLQLAF